MSKKAFLTGSHRYGKPNEKSDIDLVVFCDDVTASKLTELSDDQKIPIKFGKLNLIVCTKKAEYESWLRGTLELSELSYQDPVSREDAIKHFRAIRREMGLGQLDTATSTG